MRNENCELNAYAGRVKKGDYESKNCLMIDLKKIVR